MVPSASMLILLKQLSSAAPKCHKIFVAYKARYSISLL